jgi:hypothetical protein
MALLGEPAIHALRQPAAALGNQEGAASFGHHHIRNGVKVFRVQLETVSTIFPFCKACAEAPAWGKAGYCRL